MREPRVVSVRKHAVQQGYYDKVGLAYQVTLSTGSRIIVWESEGDIMSSACQWSPYECTTDEYDFDLVVAELHMLRFFQDHGWRDAEEYEENIEIWEETVELALDR